MKQENPESAWDGPRKYGYGQTELQRGFAEILTGHQKASERVVHSLLEHHRASYAASEDRFCVLLAFRVCIALKVNFPDWLLSKVDNLISDGIPAQKWRQFEDDVQGYEMLLAVSYAYEQDNLGGSIYERASVLLKKRRIFKEPDTIKKAIRRYQTRLDDNPHRYTAGITLDFLDWLELQKEHPDIFSSM